MRRLNRYDSIKRLFWYYSAKPESTLKMYMSRKDICRAVYVWRRLDGHTGSLFSAISTTADTCLRRETELDLIYSDFGFGLFIGRRFPS